MAGRPNRRGQNEIFTAGGETALSMFGNAAFDIASLIGAIGQEPTAFYKGFGNKQEADIFATEKARVREMYPEFGVSETSESVQQDFMKVPVDLAKSGWNSFSATNPNASEAISDYFKDPRVQHTLESSIFAAPAFARFGRALKNVPKNIRDLNSGGGNQKGFILPAEDAINRSDAAGMTDLSTKLALNHQIAKQMLEDKHDPADISEKTGFHPIPDKMGDDQLFWEVTGKTTPTGKVPELGDQQHKLPDYYENELLFALVPELKDVNLRFNRNYDVGEGLYNRNRSEIGIGIGERNIDRIDADDIDSMTGVAVHEIAHRGANMFDMDRGGAPEMFRKGSATPLTSMMLRRPPEYLQDITDEIARGTSAGDLIRQHNPPNRVVGALEDIDARQKTLQAHGNIFDDIDPEMDLIFAQDFRNQTSTEFQKYQQLAGEASANADMVRNQMSDEVRASIPYGRHMAQQGGVINPRLLRYRGQDDYMPWMDSQKVRNKESGIIRMFEESDLDKHPMFESAALAAALNQSPKSREILMSMTPDEFKKLAYPLDSYKDVKTDWLRESLVDRDEKLSEIPQLWFENYLDEPARITGHEGRHRANILDELGQENIPVRLISSETGDAPAIRWGMQDRESFDTVHPDDYPTRLRSEGHLAGTLPFPIERPMGNIESGRRTPRPDTSDLAGKTFSELTGDDDWLFDSGNMFGGKQRGAINLLSGAGINVKPYGTNSTRIPTTAQQFKQGIDAHGRNDLLVSSALLAPEKREQLADIYRTYPALQNIDPLDTEAALEESIDFMAGNLDDVLTIMPDRWREKSMEWYEGYNRIAQNAAKSHNTTNEQAGSIIAVLSPQTDWNMNLTRADRIMDTWNTRQDFGWSPEMEAEMPNLRESIGLKKYKDKLENIRGKKLKDLNGSEEKAMWIRAYDQAHNSREYNMYNPDGSRGELATKKGGAAREANWASTSVIDKAVKILEDGSPENISRQLGNEHKVRSFNRNAADPYEPTTTTMDTHAIATALMQPLSGNKPKDLSLPYYEEVPQNFGVGMSDARTGMSGTYPINQDAYNRVAGKYGIQGRAVQSPTWEFGRAMMENQKTPAQKRYADHVWRGYADGKLSRKQAFDLIVKSFGMPVSPY